MSSLAGSGEALSQHFTAVLHYAAPPANAPESLTPRLARVARLVAEQRLDAAAAELDDAVELLLLHQYPCAADGVSNSVGNSDSAGNTTQQSSGAQAALARAAAATASTAGGGPVVPMLFAVPACIYALLLSSWDEPTRAAGLSVEGISPLLEGTSVAGAAITTLDQEDDGTDVTDAGTDGPGQAGADVLQLPDSPLQRLARRQLELLARAAPTDTLAPLSASLSRLLGRQHPVAAVMRQLAEQNTSPGARAMREMRQQQRQLARARKLLQGPATSASGGLLDTQALVPVPERTWALRNVANAMLRSGATAAAAADGGGGAAAEEAVGMLRQAAQLSADHYGPEHPGQLAALLDYALALLSLGPARADEADAAVAAVLHVVEAVGKRYRTQRDLLSLVLLYESAQAELEPAGLAPSREAGSPMARLQRQAADAFDVLDVPQAALAMARRKLPRGSPSAPLRVLARDCTEQLGVYAAGRRRMTRLEQWNKGQPLAPLH